MRHTRSVNKKRLITAKGLSSNTIEFFQFRKGSIKEGGVTLATLATEAKAWRTAIFPR